MDARPLFEDLLNPAIDQDAHLMLSSIYAEFTEGFATRDLVVAAELLGQFR